MYRYSAFSVFGLFRVGRLHQSLSLSLSPVVDVVDVVAGLMMTLTLLLLLLLVLLPRSLPNQAALGESPAELALLAHVQKVLEENGQAMQTI